MLSLLYIHTEPTYLAASSPSSIQLKLILHAHIEEFLVIVEPCVSGEVGNAVVYIGMEFTLTTTDIDVIVLRRKNFL